MGRAMSENDMMELMGSMGRGLRCQHGSGARLDEAVPSSQTRRRPPTKDGREGEGSTAEDVEVKILLADLLALTGAWPGRGQREHRPQEAAREPRPRQEEPKRFWSGVLEELAEKRRREELAQARREGNR